MLLSPTRPARAARTTLLVSGSLVFLYGLLIAFGSERGFPDAMQVDAVMPYLADKPVGEDGFYMLTVAWTLAEGGGLTYNGGRKTTGIQPLATFLYGAIAWTVQAAGGDRWAFISAVLVFGLLNLFVLSALIGVIAREAFEGVDARWAAFVVAVSATLFNFWLYRALTYGLETGIYLALIAGCILYTFRALPDFRTRDALALGVLAGLAGLARLDFGLVLFVFLGAGVLLRKFSLRHGFTIGVVALAFVLPWLAWVYSVTGSWLPSSGGAQTRLISAKSAISRSQEMLEGIVNHLTPWAYPGSRPALVLASLASLLVIIAVLWYWRPSASAKPSSRWASALTLWGIALAPLVFVYTSLFWATHFYERYTAPLLLVVIPMLAVVAARWMPHRRVLLPFVPVALLAAFALWASISLHSGRIGNKHVVTTGFVAEHYPPPRLVGAFQSGAIGYFNPNVVNLDGKIDPLALKASEQDRLDVYADSVGLDVVVDWPNYLKRFPPGYLESAWTACPEPPNNGLTRCYVR